MKLILAVALFVAAAYAAPLENDVVLLKEVPSDNIGVGGYSYGYELSNGQTHQETADVINQGTEHEALAVRGSFSWVDPHTNIRYNVDYVADETGFHPKGEHIPA
ncbi:flexible cuticle protein 12-like [Halictus rubicundus]|uniref:flexible cuticle protein 12-like n=1 Tax=Halictus rubicundus TaxID=77578 RepID=UPI00403593C4